jgi:hypothetical protein
MRDDIKFTWNATNFTGKLLKIQLWFEKPELVSFTKVIMHLILII